MAILLVVSGRLVPKIALIGPTVERLFKHLFDWDQVKNPFYITRIHFQKQSIFCNLLFRKGT